MSANDFDSESVWKPIDVAKEHIRLGAGRRYATRNDMLNADINVLQLGVLQLILRELERRDDDDPLDVHRRFLLHHYDAIVKLHHARDKERIRLAALLDSQYLGRDARHSTLGDMVLYASRLYRRQWEGDSNRFALWKRLIEEQVNRLKSVKVPADVIKLKGIGKKRAAEIVAKCNSL